MTDSLKREPIVDVIELAMSRLGQRSSDKAAADDRKEAEKLDLGRRGYDIALAKRLEQLHAISSNHGEPSSTQAPAATEPPMKQPCCLRTGTMLAAMLLSITAGAGMTWLATRANPQIASAPVPVEPVATPARPEAVAPPAVAAATMPNDEDQVRQIIENWRSAWAGRDVEAYLACYGAEFKPANGQALDTWEAARRKNISMRSSIVVAINGLTLERLDAKRMKASFLQDYVAGNYRETAQPKTLLLVRNDAGWTIAGEWQGEAAASKP
jgi:hypothetical protein